MDDTGIISLFWARNEEALAETARKYGSMLSALAFRVLGDPEDSRETVNDTYLRAWDAIPPARPERLCPYLCRIVRRLAIDRLRRRDAQKRAGESYALALEELSDCVSGREKRLQRGTCQKHSVPPAPRTRRAFAKGGL